VLSQFPGRDAYYRIRRAAGEGTEFTMSPHPEGYAAMRCNPGSTGHATGRKRWYRFKIQVAAEAARTIVRAKVWRRSHDEPRKWQIECVDESPTRLTQGAPGVWSAGPGAKHWDDLRVIPLDPGALELEGESEGRRAKPAPGAPPGKPVLLD
jgi:hypothetical protein